MDGLFNLFLLCIRVADDDTEAWHDAMVKSGGQRLLRLHGGMWKF
jgi:hypothetical protein